MLFLAKINLLIQHIRENWFRLFGCLLLAYTVSYIRHNSEFLLDLLVWVDQHFSISETVRGLFGCHKQVEPESPNCASITQSSMSSDTSIYYMSVYELAKRTCHRVFGDPLFTREQEDAIIMLYASMYLCLFTLTTFYYFIMMTLPYLGITRWEGKLHPRFFTLVLLLGVFSIGVAFFFDQVDQNKYVNYVYMVLMESNPNTLNPVIDRPLNVLFHIFSYPTLIVVIANNTQHPLNNERRKRIGKYMIYYIFADATLYLYMFITGELPPGF